MAPTKFIDANISDVLAQLSDEEKMTLLGAPNWWNTNKIDRLGVPPIRMSDGPNGVRGSSHFLSSPAQCIPCATSMGATFDPELIREAGAFLAAEAKLKSAVCLLAPTCNIQRNPLGGRAFESFSEDPHLSGTLAAAYVNGLQKNGVAATIKHFVCNDQEHERTAASSEVSDRALREIYLMPFMIAQRDAQPIAYMTSYGRVNGTHASESPWLIGEEGILRKEWGFKGLVMSDWFGTYGVDLPIKAGLDLEMPGPPRWRNPLLMSGTYGCQKVTIADIENRAANVLEFAQRIARLSPDTVFGDGVEHETKDTPEVKAFNRRLASEGMVLLKNSNSALPLGKGLKVAVIGPNAKGRVASGGGSAFLKSSYVVRPWEGLSQNVPEGTTLEYSLGCYAHKYLPTLETQLTTSSGKPGWTATFFSNDASGQPTGEPLGEYVLNDTRVKLNDFIPAGLTPTWTMKLSGNLHVESDGPFELGLTVSGRAKLWVDDKLAIDNWTKQRPGDFFYGQGTIEEKATLELKASKPAKVYVEYSNVTPDDGRKRDLSQPALMLGVRLGGCPAIDPDRAVEDAVTLAKNSDAAILVVGLTSEWEAEGSDRPTMDLPARQHELIEKVSAANPRTVVVIQAGSATSIPYVDSAAAILQAWYSGNEVGNAIADVVFGKVNPSGKLPISLPRRIEDIGPAAFNIRSENGKILYAEDLFVGYKNYTRTGVKPLFPFGFGLSYSTFSVSKLEASAPAGKDASSFSVELSVNVTNTSSLPGSEVVQAYITLPSTSKLTHPSQQLKAFTKVKNLSPGETATAVLKLSKYSVSYWDDRINHWVAEKGEYTVHVGTSSAELPLTGTFVIDQAFTWSGI
ncbi:hypothetical protein FRC04_009906 [Tulasnella sp. 424]|nr:hypothetical protein FRC04_009906 [Tulasnella sp. 424]KAG8970997.1 hypothetical protein FRC05_011572 [Tulasnella sp. 425]